MAEKSGVYLMDFRSCLGKAVLGKSLEAVTVESNRVGGTTFALTIEQEHADYAGQQLWRSQEINSSQLRERQNGRFACSHCSQSSPS